MLYRKIPVRNPPRYRPGQLRRVYRIWLALSEHPCATLRELLVLAGYKSSSLNIVQWALRDLSGYGFASHRGFGKKPSYRLHTKLHRLAGGRVGFWIGD